jgi:hypothetical protein
VTIRRHPLPPQHAAALSKQNCDTPPPEAGRLDRPPHPLLGILFLFVLSEAVLFGALGGPHLFQRLVLSYGALFLCLVGAVHWVERVELRHVPATLGLRLPHWRWLAAASAASLPAWIAIATGHLRLGGEKNQPVEALPLAAALGLASLWLEGFCRGYAFRGLMRRYGFVLSAGTASLLGVGSFLLPWSFTLSGATTTAAPLLELFLSMSLAQLDWASESVWPCVLIRFSTLLALFSGACWPMAAAAIVAAVIVTRSIRREAA